MLLNGKLPEITSSNSTVMGHGAHPQDWQVWGGVIRNSEGYVLACFAFFQENVGSSVDAEGLSILFAMRWAKKYNLKQCSFETDCANAFSLIHCFGGDVLHNSMSWIAECANLLILESKWSLSLIRREANSVADKLAKKAVAEKWSWLSDDGVPLFIGSIL